jgi:SAM-dependent methyltransferase
MKILKNWNQIGDAVNSLKANALPIHSDPAKSWDFSNIREILMLNNISHDAKIIDLGCGASIYGAITLELLRFMGYKNLIGVDLYIPLYARLGAAIRGLMKFKQFIPYRLKSGDMTSINLASQSIDMAILLSVVEHGVDLDKLFGNLARILKIGGIVYLSTDYWHEKINIVTSFVASGAHDNKPLSWTIFDLESLQNLIEIAKKHGFCPSGDEIPSCEDSPVYWQGVNYTFVALEFKKI